MRCETFDEAFDVFIVGKSDDDLSSSVFRAFDGDLLREETFELLDKARVTFGILFVLGSRYCGWLLGKRAGSLFGLTLGLPLFLLGLAV